MAASMDSKTGVRSVLLQVASMAAEMVAKMAAVRVVVMVA
jgi:hypothetical protein